MSSVLAVIQARVNSSRLPRKSLAIIGCRASVFHVWKRADLTLGRAFVAVPADDFGDFGAVIPTSLAAPPDAAEDDVLRRLVKTYWAVERGERVVVRLTGDCPFVDPDGIRAVVAAIEDGADYATLAGIPNGFDAEAFTADLLMDAHKYATGEHDREHVTPWMQRNATNPATIDRGLPRWRLTLDTQADLDHLRAIAAEIDCTPPHPTVEELLALMERRPDLVRYDA